MTRPDKTEFTIESANLTLPLVRAIVDDIVCLSDEIADTRERLDYLTYDRDCKEAPDDYSQELSSIEQITDLKSDKVDRFHEELEQLGVLSADAADGYANFLADREGERVCLCWRLGENAVAYWHGLDEGCSMRRPVDLALIRQSGNRRHSEVV